MTRLLVIALGGAAGALARYGLAGLVQRRTPNPFPAGTLAVNVVGCLLLGAFTVWLESRQEALHPELRYLVAVGFLGALTTFSTFGYETLELLRAGDHGLALGSVVLNLILGVGGVLAGRLLAQFLAG